MRWDVEQAAASVIAAYLQGSVAPTTSGPSPIVTYFDPMSVDEANRIVIFVPSGETMLECAGDGTLAIEVGIKSRWLQPTVNADFAAHWSRVKDVRDSLFPSDLATRLNNAAAAMNPAMTGFVVNFIKPVRAFHTRVMDGWLYSETSFQMTYYVNAPENQ
jgi:hypothetical protein